MVDLEIQRLWICKYCGAGYEELEDNINGCQECGAVGSMVSEKVWVNDIQVPATYRKFPYLKGMVN